MVKILSRAKRDKLLTLETLFISEIVPKLNIREEDAEKTELIDEEDNNQQQQEQRKSVNQ